MKLQKLFVSAAIGCLLVGVSGAAVAADVTCEDGLINNETVDNVTVTGRSCHISETIVEGDVTVTDSPNLTMTNNRVAGQIKVTSSTGSGDVLLKDNRVFANPIVVQNVARVLILDNTLIGDTTKSNMSFDDNTDEVNIFSNEVAGDLLCSGNNFVATSGNFVFGSDTCSLQ